MRSAHSSNDMAGYKSFHNEGNLLFLWLSANISSGQSAKKLSFHWTNDTKHPNNWKILTSIRTINTIHDIPAQLLPCLSSRRCMNRAGNIPGFNNPAPLPRVGIGLSFSYRKSTFIIHPKLHSCQRKAGNNQQTEVQEVDFNTPINSELSNYKEHLQGHRK